MGALGWIIGGAILGAALSGSSDSGTRNNRCGNCGTTCSASYRNRKGKLVYVCPHCGHTWSK